MAKQTESGEFSSFLEEHLPFYDELLASVNTPLQQRPIRAALLFAKHCIVAVEGDDKNKPFGKPWFRAVYKSMAKWYENRYAAAMDEKRENYAPGLVPIYNTPFALAIPLTLLEAHERGKSVWLSFPNEVLAGERVLEWFNSAPNFERMSNEELSRTKTDIARVATATRGIRINLMTATDRQGELQGFISSIPVHIDKSVRDILRLDTASIGLSFWEMHLAVEKALKFLIRQRGTVPPKVHDLLELSRIASEATSESVDVKSIQALPSHREAIRLRYAEGKPRTVDDAIRNYRRVLDLVAGLTKSLKREFVLNNARILIRSLAGL